MYYGRTKKFTDWDDRDIKSWKVRLLYLLFFFIPKANPDHEKLYPKVKEWLLEIDQSEQPVREIALDKDGNVLFASPNKRNFGFWTDVDGPVRKHELLPVEQSVFEDLWRKASQNA
jgi:hypothetical protein